MTDHSGTTTTNDVRKICKRTRFSDYTCNIPKEAPNVRNIHNNDLTRLPWILKYNNTLRLFKMQITIKAEMPDGTKDWALIEMQVRQNHQFLTEPVEKTTIIRRFRETWNPDLETSRWMASLLETFTTPRKEYPSSSLAITSCTARSRTWTSLSWSWLKAMMKVWYVNQFVEFFQE